MSFEVSTIYNAQGKNIADCLAEFDTLTETVEWLKVELLDPFWRDAHEIGISNRENRSVIFITVNEVMEG